MTLCTLRPLPQPAPNQCGTSKQLPCPCRTHRSLCKGLLHARPTLCLTFLYQTAPAPPLAAPAPAPLQSPRLPAAPWAATRFPLHSKGLSAQFASTLLPANGLSFTAWNKGNNKKWRPSTVVKLFFPSMVSFSQEQAFHYHNLRNRDRLLHPGRKSPRASSRGLVPACWWRCC